MTIVEVKQSALIAGLIIRQEEEFADKVVLTVSATSEGQTCDVEVYAHHIVCTVFFGSGLSFMYGDSVEFYMTKNVPGVATVTLYLGDRAVASIHI